MIGADKNNRVTHERLQIDTVALDQGPFASGPEHHLADPPAMLGLSWPAFLNNCWGM
jgi:hypothetical protein